MSALRELVLALPEDDLQEFVLRQRWYGSKSEEVASVRAVDAFPLREEGEPLLAVAVVEARFASGMHDLYNVPVGLRRGRGGFASGSKRTKPNEIRNVALESAREGKINCSRRVLVEERMTCRRHDAHDFDRFARFNFSAEIVAHSHSRAAAPSVATLLSGSKALRPPNAERPTRGPSVAFNGVNECPVPGTRTGPLPLRTAAANATSSFGATISLGLQTTPPDQFDHLPPTIFIRAIALYDDPGRAS